MTRHRLTLATLVALLAVGVLLTAGCGGGSTISPDAVAVVDGTKITRADLNARLIQDKASYVAKQQTFPQAGTPEYQSLQQTEAQNLIKIIEVEQEAKRQNISVSDAELAKRTDALIKQCCGGSKVKYAAALKSQLGTTPDAYRSIIRVQALYEKLAASITKDVKVTDAEVKAYYDKNKATAYATPESRSMRHILVKTLAEAKALQAQLSAGADFAALEKKHSLDTGTNQQGGILVVSKGQTVPEYEKVAFTLKTGTVSAPVHSKQYGYFLIKPVGDLKPATTKSFSSVAKDIRANLLQTKQSEVLKAWTDKLNKSYADKIKYALGFAPPAAATTPSTTTG
jgi:parvulin-like peptidyl-prolyl isomerase